MISARSPRLAGVVAGLLLLAAGAAAGVVSRARADAKSLRARLPPRAIAARAAAWEALLAAREESLAADRAGLSALAPLQTMGDRSDAGPELNPMFEWPVPWPSRPRSFTPLPPALVERLGGWRPEHVERIAAIELSNIDLRWMARLSQFDHWDLERNSPWDDVSPSDYASGWFTDREPRLEVLTAWAKLRLMKGLRDDEPWNALAETRQLARLLVSTQSLLATVEALVIEQIERQAFVAALASHPEEVQGWQPLGDQDAMDRAIRAVRSLPSLLTPAAPAADRDRAIAAKQFGFCAALREAANAALWLRPLIEDGHRDYYEALERLTRRDSGCRLTMLRRAFARAGPLATWRAVGHLGDDALPLPPGRSAPAFSRLVYLLSPELRAAAGEPLMYEFAVRTLGTVDY